MSGIKSANSQKRQAKGVWGRNPLLISSLMRDAQGGAANLMSAIFIFLKKYAYYRWLGMSITVAGRKAWWYVT